MEYQKVRRTRSSKMNAQSIYGCNDMFSTNTLTLPLSVVVLIICFWLYGRYVLVKASERGQFSLFGYVYTVRLERQDQPQNGLPEALREPDNGAFAENTLGKVKSLSAEERYKLSTMDDLVS